MVRGGPSQDPRTHTHYGNKLWRCPTASQRTPEMADRSADGMLSVLAAFTHPSLENLNAATPPPWGSDSVEVQMAQKKEFKFGPQNVNSSLDPSDGQPKDASDGQP